MIQSKLPKQLGLLLLIPVSMFFFSCGKDDPDPTPEPGDGTLSTGIYRRVDLAADTTATSASEAKLLYFSLERNEVVDPAKRYSADWDIAFGGIYNSSLYVNNGKSRISPGYGGPGIGGMHLVIDSKFDAQYYDTVNFVVHTLPIPWVLFDQAFAAVKTVPVEDHQLITNNYLSLDHFQSPYDGWGYYDFYGSLFPDNPKKAHIVYSLPRVIIVKTARGKYTKLIIRSVYKGAPLDPTRDHRPGYITFEYAYQANGSKSLDIQ